MPYVDGMRLIGHYGTEFVRRGGRWATPGGGLTICDDTVDWLVSTDFQNHPAAVFPQTAGKISKSKPDPVHPYQYRWTIKEN